MISSSAAPFVTFSISLLHILDFFVNSLPVNEVPVARGCMDFLSGRLLVASFSFPLLILISHDKYTEQS
jgi:hypothetical protein